MHVSPEAKHLVPKPAYGHRIGVTVSIGNRDYRSQTEGPDQRADQRWQMDNHNLTT